MTIQVRDYLPLMVVVLVAVLMSLSVSSAEGAFAHRFMEQSMGFFLCLLAMLKLFDISGFANGFQMYDVVAKQFRPYALVYPFIELSLGLSYVANTMVLATNLVTLVVMSVSALGVIKSIRAGMDVRCACLGTVLKVPLSTVSVIENMGMGVMAGLNLLLLWSR